MQISGFIRWTGYCNHLILMYEMSVMLIFNNHLQCLQINNCILPIEKIDELNDMAELTFLHPRHIELFQIWGKVRKSGFGRKFRYSMIPHQFRSSTSSLTLRAAARLLTCWARRSCFIRFSKTDISEWNCSNLAGSTFAKSCETLLNSAKFNKEMNLNIVG